MSHTITEPHVPETAFGKWFLQTRLWSTRVLDVAIADLARLIDDPTKEFPVIVDVACGFGYSLKKIHNQFKPRTLIGLDIDPDMLEASAKEVKNDSFQVEFKRCSNASISLPSESVDMVFCHQTFHHIIDQNAAINEYFRILKPGGTLLFAESTKRYINSWLIRYLFAHPMSVQKTAEEYIDLIRETGFEIDQNQISLPFLWWSREDLGIMENWFGVKPPADKEETLVNLIATKPLS